QAITMNPATMLVRKAPAPTSSRDAYRSLGPRCLSAAYDWMKAWPQGVMVVPTVPITATRYRPVAEPCGISVWESAVPQSGLERNAEMAYASEVPIPTARNTNWTRRKFARDNRKMMASAARAELSQIGTPKIARAAPIPANSATVSPRLARSLRPLAKTARGPPYARPTARAE